MDSLAENNLVRFVNLTRKKEGLFANFRIKGIKGGTLFTASLSVDISAADVSSADPLENIIEACAKVAVRDFKKSEVHFEGISAI